MTLGLLRYFSHLPSPNEFDLFFCFRNIYCALCNGVVPSVYTVLVNHGRAGSPSEIYSFSGLLKLNIKEEAVVVQNLECSFGLIYDIALVS